MYKPCWYALTACRGSGWLLVAAPPVSAEGIKDSAATDCTAVAVEAKVALYPGAARVGGNIGMFRQ